MSKISLAPDASGTGIFTIVSPNSNTNRTLTLPDDTGTIVTNSGNQAGSFTTLNTSGAVVFNDAGANVDFRVEGDTEANLLFVDASTDRVGVGTSSPSYRTDIRGASTTLLNVEGTSTAGAAETVFRLAQPADTISANNEIRSGVTGGTNPYMSFAIRETNSPFATVERMRIDSSGNVGIGTSSPTAVSDYTVLHLTGRSTSQGGLIRLETSDGTSGVMRMYMSGTAGTVEVSTADPLIFATNSTERMKIASDGKTSINYATAGDCAFTVTNTNGSFADIVNRFNADRSATTSYSFYESWSGGYGDLEFRLRGDGNAFADGSWAGSGADYAEYFESATGEAIQRGTTVVLENNKVRAATVDDPASSIIGVVRPKEFGKGSMVIGNLAWNMWTDKYITDDFGVYEMEDHDVVEWDEQVLQSEAVEAVVDEEGNEVSPAQEATYKTVSHSYESWNIPEGVTVPANATRKTHDDNGKKFQHRKLNPNYDPAVEYTPREERPEWLIIGLLGQVPVLKGQPVGDRWVKMRDISEAVEEWMIR